MPTNRRSTASSDEVRVVVLAGGMGTRLRPYTAVLPKPLMPVGDLPILEIIVRQLRRNGFRRITLAVGHLSSLVQAYFGDGSRWDVRLDYLVEDSPLGTAGPLATVRDEESTYLVMNGDVLTTLPYAEVVERHKKSENAATVAVCTRDVGVNLGVVEVDSTDRITAYREKPVLTYSASMGVYVLDRASLDRIEEGTPLDMPDLLRAMMGDGKRVGAYRFDGYWRDIGNHDDFELVCEEFASMRTSLLPE